MNGKSNKASVWATIAAFLASAVGTAEAIGQETTRSEPSEKEIQQALDEIVVTAQKREQNVLDVPMSIVALGSADLDARGIKSFEDLGMAVPGLSVNDGGDGWGRRIYLRGIGNIAGTTSLIGIYMDEVPLSTFPTLQLDVRAYDLERIEVLRGPQGTLYGQGSVGGTIRFITNQPQLDQFDLKADVSTSFTKDGDQYEVVQGAINAPLVEDTLALRIAGQFSDGGGWIDQPAASQANINDETLVDMRIKVLWQPNQVLAVNAMSNIHRNDRGAPPIGEDEDGNFTQVFGLSTTPASEDDYAVHNLALTLDLSGVQLLSSTSYLTTDKATSAVGYRFATLAGLLNVSQKTNVFTEEIRLSSNIENGWQWTLGAFYQDYDRDYSAFEHFGLDDGPLPAASPPNMVFERSRAWAAFADTSVDLTERFEVGGGLRYFEDDRAQWMNVFPTRQHRSFDSLSPRVYASLSVGENARIYGSIAKGFRSGGFNFNPSLPAVDPENVWTYELGTKAALLGGRLNSELALFYSDYRDYQIFGALPGQRLAHLSNGGNAEIKGVEFGVGFQAGENWSIELSGNYVDAQFDEVSVDGSHIVGDRVSLIPEYQFTFSSTYDFELMKRSAYVRLDYNQKGRAEYTNRPTVVGDLSDVINMLNARLEWQLSDAMFVALYATNLLNDRGYTDPWKAFAAAARSRPRTIGFNVGLEF